MTDALRKCPELVLVKPHHSMYREKSKAFIAILKQYSDVIEQVSVDEAFVDMTGTGRLFGPPPAVADRIREQVKNELGFTVNIGISSCKILAKMASDFEKPDKVHTLFVDEIPGKMWPLPVRELFSWEKPRRSACIPLESGRLEIWRRRTRSFCQRL